jgi:hypothetical protein
MRIALAVIALATILGPPAAADEVRILSSRGGEVTQFIDMFDHLRKSGDSVVIDGPCLSACTLVLSAVPKDRICVTRRAVLGFHAARLIDPRGRFHAQPEASEIMFEMYPSAVRGWIRQHGGLTSHLLLLRGATLLAFIGSVGKYAASKWIGASLDSHTVNPKGVFPGGYRSRPSPHPRHAVSDLIAELPANRSVFLSGRRMAWRHGHPRSEAARLGVVISHICIMDGAGVTAWRSLARAAERACDLNAHVHLIRFNARAGHCTVAYRRSADRPRCRRIGSSKRARHMSKRRRHKNNGPILA